MDFILDKKVVDPSQLATLLIRLKKNYGDAFGKPELNAVFDPEERDFMFLEVVFPHGDWEAWKRLAKEIKSKMKGEWGMVELASKVAIVCLEALREVQS